MEGIFNSNTATAITGKGNTSSQQSQLLCESRGLVFCHCLSAKVPLWSVVGTLFPERLRLCSKQTFACVYSHVTKIEMSNKTSLSSFLGGWELRAGNKITSNKNCQTGIDQWSFSLWQCPVLVLLRKDASNGCILPSSVTFPPSVCYFGAFCSSKEF